MKVLCPHCERLITLEQFRLEGGALVVTCPRCQQETRVEASAPVAATEATATVAAAPEPSAPPPPAPPPRSVNAPPRVSLASTEGASNVVVLRTAAHDAVQKAAKAADEGPFDIPEGVCPKCIAKRAEAEACPHCGIRFEKFDEATVLPPKWLRDDWVALLRDWGTEARHAQLRRKAQQADALAAVGRLYRLRQAAVPEDPVAETGRTEVLRMAAVGIAFRPPAGDEAERRKKAVLVGALVITVGLLAFLVLQLLRAR